MKFLFSFIAIVFYLSNYAQNNDYVKNEKSTSEQQEIHSLIIRVSYIYKQNTIENRFNLDIGTNIDHPLYGNISEAKSKIVLTINGTSTTFSNEIDLFNALSKLGWKIVSVNIVTIISTQYVQYLLQN